MFLRALSRTLGLLAVLSSAAFAQGIHPADYKDPGTATVLSVVVIGGGQFYAGDTRKGALLLGVGLGSIIVGEGIGLSMCSSGSCGAGGPLALAGLAVGLGSWIYGIMDASDAAARHNATLPKSRASVSPVILPAKGGGSNRLGLSLNLKV